MKAAFAEVRNRRRLRRDSRSVAKTRLSSSNQRLEVAGFGRADAHRRGYGRGVTPWLPEGRHTIRIATTPRKRSDFFSEPL
jgi:hypothetical protein